MADNEQDRLPLGRELIDRIARHVFDGLTLKQAAEDEGYREVTLNAWLQRGRREAGTRSDYDLLVKAVDRARIERNTHGEPMDLEELLRVASIRARRGDVSAMRVVLSTLTLRARLAGLFGEHSDERRDEPRVLSKMDELAKKRAQARGLP